MAEFKHGGGKRGFKGAPRGSFGGGFGGGKKFGGGFKKEGFGGGYKGGSQGSADAKPYNKYASKFDRDSRPQVMHAATCSSCNKSCQVPFAPTPEKPVYCRDCFAGRAALGGERSSGDRRFPLAADRTPQPRAIQSVSDGYELKKQLEAINTKLERLINAVNARASISPISNTPQVAASDAVIAEVAAPVTKAPKKKSIKK